MGTSISSLLSPYLSKKRIVLIGQPASGKTTILYHSKRREIVTTIPTIGFNVETVDHQNITFYILDIGGGDKMRGLWPCYLYGADGIIFVIDCKDRQMLKEVWNDLVIMLQDVTLRNVPVLLFANKQDLEGSMGVSELVDYLDLNRQLADRRWHIQATSTLQGNGLRAGFLWLANELGKSSSTIVK